ncbi:MAG: bacteriohemerythrin [Kiritimatiellae bacterium]|nr:bacteriohemerythrin [Kiritimatiellia bacterium]
MDAKKNMPNAWTKDLATGLRVIDAQHRQYFARVARLQNACLSCDPDDEIERALDFVTDYAEFHFATEERLMDKHDYPGASGHKRKHEGFRREVAQLRERFKKAGSNQIRLELTGMLVDWLRNHIPTVDAKLVEFIRSKTEK